MTSQPHLRKPSPRAAGAAGSGGLIIKRIASVLLWGLVGLLIVAPVAVWTALALYYRLPAAETVRQVAAGVVAALGLAAFVLAFTRRRWRAFAGLAVVFCAAGNVGGARLAFPLLDRRGRRRERAYALAAAARDGVCAAIALRS